MKISKTVVSTALVGLFVANAAMALPGINREAPQESVDACVAEVNAHADFNGAGSVQHRVETEERHNSGHKMSIDTVVYDAGSETVIRQYRAFCAIDSDAEIQRFKIRQKSS